MAARVLLLSILFTEVLKPVSCAGIKGIGSGVNRRDGSKQDSLEPGPMRNLDLSLQIEPKEDVILGKKGITLSCNVNPTQDITWFHNGVEAPPCGISRCTLLRSGALHFYKKKNLEVTPKRKGWDNSSKIPAKDEYRCVVRTNFGGYLQSPSVSVRLAKLSRTFKEQPKDVKVYEGEVARLSCLVDSVPFPPKITWEHNSSHLSFDQDSKKYTFIPPGVLYISATKLSDAGSYRCTAANDYLNKTTISNNAELTVVSKLANEHSISSLLPQTSYKYVLTKKSNLRMVCAVSGYPPSVTTWSFISRNSVNKTRPIFLLNSTTGISVLTLENVGASDSGFYICSTKNSYNGSIEYQNVTVDVLIPPTFLKKPTSQVCPNGSTARFECQAQGYPTPRIYWLKDAKDVTINGRRTIYEKDFHKMELAISATVPTDSGVYQCVAVNEVGEILAAGRLQVNTSRHSPDAPTALKCHALSPKRIHISWKPPKYLPSTNITAYTVHYSPVEGGKEEVSPPELGNITSVEVSKLLEPFTNYSFYVRLYNNHGASDQSTTITCSTAPSVPKSAPKINFNAISSSKLNVSWEPLTKSQAQGVIVEYKLQWRLHEHPSSRILYLPSTVENYILTDLTPETQYDVRVLAKTEQGWPTISESQLPWRTITMPSPETGQFTIKNLVDVSLMNINASVVSMKWAVNEKSNQNLGPQFLAWHIYCENQKGEKLETSLLPKNVTEYLFTNLEANTSYIMGLCMITLNEAKNCLNKRVESAGRSLSNIPTALEAIPASANSINLTWSIADTYRDNVFEICYHAVHIMKDTSNCIFVNGTMATCENLKPFTLYQFKIRVLDDEPNENTEFSQAIECYTSEDIPGKVEDVQWFLGNSTLIKLAWKEPTRINGIIQKYFIVYTMDLSNSDLWENITVPGNKTTTSLPGLISGRRYFVIVQAATKAGNGKPSDPIIIVTGGSASKIPTSSGEQKPSPNVKPDQSLGVILGLSISIVCIGICLCSMYCRRKWETSRSLRDTPQPLKSRTLMRNGNGCCVDRSSISVSQQLPHNTMNEIELSVLCPPTTNPHLDTKGFLPNGVIESNAKEPLLNPWNSNRDSKDLRITENPQYKARGSNTSSKHQDHDLDDTQLTTVNCTLRSSTSSLNNNVGGLESIASAEKITANFPPILEPNG